MRVKVYYLYGTMDTLLMGTVEKDCHDDSKMNNEDDHFSLFLSLCVYITIYKNLYMVTFVLIS